MSQPTISSLVKGALFSLTLVLLAGLTSAQTATIINDADCDVQVVLSGATSGCNWCPHNSGTAITVPANSTVSNVTLVSGSGTCTIVDGIKARVFAGGNFVTVKTDDCSSCVKSDIYSANLTFPAFPSTCYAAPQTHTVDLSCSGTTYTVHVQP